MVVVILLVSLHSLWPKVVSPLVLLMVLLIALLIVWGAKCLTVSPPTVVSLVITVMVILLLLASLCCTLFLWFILFYFYTLIGTFYYTAGLFVFALGYGDLKRFPFILSSYLQVFNFYFIFINVHASVEY